MASDAPKGGWSDPVHGSLDGQPVTAAFGTGSLNQGETLLSDGHVDPATFLQSGNHNHYGSGNGPNDNAKDRGRYTGPDA